MAFLPCDPPNAVTPTNFIDLAANFNTSREEAEHLLSCGLSMDDIREYKRVQNNTGQHCLQ